MKTAILLACLIPCSAFAAPVTPENSSASAGNAFSSTINSQFKFDKRAAPAVAAKPAGRIVKAASSQYVHVSGSVNLTGSGNVPRGSSFAYVNFSGNGTVSDSSGRVTSNYTWFNQNVGCNVNGGWINCNSFGQWQVQFYKDGRYVGTGSLSGNINASAYAPNGFFNVSSFVSLSGDVFVSEP